ncbi:ATP-binding protein [Phenylobacterium kunshanense]|uniref:ATP-binding protein n=1 Tax=Phenylobacterium kunshanense TaxID=1445034 RepID=UPI001401EA06|nr:ATP-binding protein [Phenylobacterium kunshanense]
MAGWNPFKRKTATKAAQVDATPPAVVKPLIRESHRRTAETGGLPRFKSTASDQVSSRGGDRFAAVRARLRDAFTPSQPVADRRFFAGREDVLRAVIRSIEDQRLHVVLYGERGIGKTSLLHVLTQAASEARYIVVYTSCGANSKFDETFRAAAAEIPLLFHSGYSPTATEAEKGATLADLLPAEPLTPRKFGDLASKLTGTRVLIILDEFDRVDSGAFRRDVAELIKNLSDRLGRVQLVLAGVAADLTELVEHIPSIRRNIFALRVPKMTETEVLQIVANGERETDLKFDADASASVVTVARGSPYLASLLCHHAGHAALDDGRNVVQPADVARAVDMAVTEFEGRLPKPVQAHVRRLFDQGRAEVLALAARAALSSDGIVSAAEIAASGEITARKAEEIINALVAEGLLRPNLDGGDERFAFVEDGLPTLIWMTWAQHNLQSDTQPARTPAVAAS